MKGLASARLLGQPVCLGLLLDRDLAAVRAARDPVGKPQAQSRDGWATEGPHGPVPPAGECPHSLFDVML